MTLSYSTATLDDVEELCEVDARNFGAGPFTAEEIEQIKRSFDLSRFVIVRDPALTGQPIVAAAGNFGLELTLPGPTTVPMAGVTWVSVSSTHRRKGIATKMMAWLHDDARKHREPVIGLTASEGGIYERFGYGICTRLRTFSIDRRRVQMAERFQADTSSIRLVDHTRHYPEICALFDRYRQRRVGEVELPEWLAQENFRHSGSDRIVCALHPEGFGIWVISQDWADGDPRHGIRVWMLCALTDEAHRALWTLLLSTDLAGEVSGRVGSGPDDPLPFFLTNPRALRTTGLTDHLWIKVLDPKGAFAARSYRTDDAFVVEVPDGEKLKITAEGVSSARRRKRADLTLEESALGPLLTGGASASVLAAGHRLRPSSPRVLQRADAFFGVSPEPYCSVGF